MFKLAMYVLLIGIVVQSADAQSLQAHPKAKVFKGYEGESITMVFLEPRNQNQILIKFDGVDGDWDGRVIAHERVLLGTNREDYVVKGEKYVSVVYRGDYYEVFPKSSPRRPIRMRYAEKESAKVNVDDVVKAYQGGSKK